MNGVTSTAEKKADSSDLDDFLEGDAEEGGDLAQARRNLDTLARNIYKDGYREGLEPLDSSASLQRGFDSGYSAAFAVTRDLAALRSELSTFARIFKVDEKDKEGLDRLKEILREVELKQEALGKHIREGKDREDQEGWTREAKDIADVSKERAQAEDMFKALTEKKE